MAKIPMCLLFGLLALPAGLVAQTRASAVPDRERVEAGDTFALRVLVSGVRVAPLRVNFAAWQNFFPADNILARSEWSRSGAQWVQQFTLIALDSATLDLPPLTVNLHLGDTVRTNPLQLRISAPRASSDLSDMDDIRDIRREPAAWYDHWAVFAGSSFVLLLAAWYLYRKRRRAKPAPVAIALAPPPPSARELALEKLQVLEKEKPWQKGRLLEYYSALSLIVRAYLEHRYDIPALESTTGEISAMLPGTDFPEALRPVLDFLLQQADLVKYAETAPSRDFHEQALEKARQVIGG
ncbi:MAG: hypothetical protein IPM98_00915 [Lewinellaceae bacterium]|nr:hypothetical protein [Lewinellaceae bacterium]